MGQMGGMQQRGASTGGNPGSMDESAMNKPSGADGSVCPEGQFAAPKLHTSLARGAIVANGCGPQGMQVAEDFGLWRCCNRHDVCFSACDIKFSYCESMYKECLTTRCNKYNKDRLEQCMEQVNSFTGMTGMFGGATFASSMKGVCDCVGSKNKQKKAMKAYARQIVDEFGDDEHKGNKSYINDLVAKYEEDKHGHLYFDLMMQYGTQQGYVPFDNIANSFDVAGPSQAKRQASMHQEM